MLEEYKTGYKFTPYFWNYFSKKAHYFKDHALIKELKLSAYLDFLKGINLNNSFVLKTDLYVEAKNERDNFLPYLEIERCVGMDISLEIVKMAKENLMPIFPEMKFVVADVRHLPFKVESFDTVISDSTLDHVPKNDLSPALLEIKRIMSRRGRFIISLNNIFNYPLVFSKKVKELFIKDEYISFFYNPRYILALLRRFNFKIINRDYILPLDSLVFFLIKAAKRIKSINLLLSKWVFVIMQISKLSCLRPFLCIQFALLTEMAAANN